MTLPQTLEQAVAHHRAGRLADAEREYRQVLADHPDNPDALHLLGVVVGQSGQLDAAIDLIRRSIALRPHAQAYSNLGIFLHSVKHVDQAEESFRAAIRLNPEDPAAHYNLGSVLRELGRFHDAEAACSRSAELDPNSADIWNNLAMIQQDLDDFDSAIASYRKAVALSPDNARLHWNLSLALLGNGELAEGWKEFDWRLSAHLRRNFSQPMWDGRDLTNKTLLIYTEGGFGDALQFIRYVPLLAGRAKKIVLECQPALFALLSRVPGIDQTVRRDREALPQCDYQIPLQSLPRIFRTDVTNIPASVPYICVPPLRRQRWSHRIPRDAKLNVGLVWAGTPYRAEQGDRRTRDLAYFAPLAGVPNLRLVSLQKGDDAAQPRPPGMELLDFSAEIRDFADTAPIIEQLDLVISVDTSIAHLAGAMAKPTWVLIYTPSDFRWLRHRTDSPWYPTMRLFRQPKPRDWETPMRQLVEELCLLAQRKAS